MSISHLLLTRESSFDLEGGHSDDESRGCVCIPSKMRPVKEKSGKKIRTVFMAMLVGHMGFMACELLLYNLMVSLLFSECVYMWLCYFCYQTMNTVAIYAYIVVLGLACPLGVLNLLGTGGWFIIYLGQLSENVPCRPVPKRAVPCRSWIQYLGSRILDP